MTEHMTLTLSPLWLGIILGAILFVSTIILVSWRVATKIAQAQREHDEQVANLPPEWIKVYETLQKLLGESDYADEALEGYVTGIRDTIVYKKNEESFPPLTADQLKTLMALPDVYSFSNTANIALKALFYTLGKEL